MALGLTVISPGHVIGVGVGVDNTLGGIGVDVVFAVDGT